MGCCMSHIHCKVLVLGALLFVAAVPRLHAQIVITGLNPGESLDVWQHMEFGTAVGIAGGTSIVGAPGTDGHGAAYVFSGSGPDWTLSAKLVAPDIAPGRFGSQIVFDGTALIADSDRAQVYYFTFDGRKWRPRAILHGGASGFGAAIAMQGCLALITSAGSTALNQPGFVHVFDRCSTSDSNWRFVKSFTPKGTRAEDGFGASIALSGTQLLVGAPGWGNGSGAVYYYVSEGGNWILKQRFVQTIPPLDGAFGTAVALHDSFAVVGSPRARGTEEAATSGVAYTFSLTGKGWTQIGETRPTDNPFGWAGFGQKIVVTADRVLIGAPTSLSHQYSNPGSLYTYRRSGTSLTQVAHWEGDARGFGWDFAVSGSSVIVGEPYYFVQPGTAYGVVNVFQLPP